MFRPACTYFNDVVFVKKCTKTIWVFHLKQQNTAFTPRSEVWNSSIFNLVLVSNICQEYGTSKYCIYFQNLVFDSIFPNLVYELVQLKILIFNLALDSAISPKSGSYFQNQVSIHSSRIWFTVKSGFDSLIQNLVHGFLPYIH